MRSSDWYATVSWYAPSYTYRGTPRAVLSTRTASLMGGSYTVLMAMAATSRRSMARSDFSAIPGLPKAKPRFVRMSSPDLYTLYSL